MSKVDQHDVAEVSQWIGSVLKEDAPEFPEGYKTGVVLCKLVNALKPGSVKKVNPAKLAFHRMENIENFNRALKNEFGFEDRDNFVTVDLYEEKDLHAVIKTLLCLKRQFVGVEERGHTGSVFDKEFA